MHHTDKANTVSSEGAPLPNDVPKDKGISPTAAVGKATPANAAAHRQSCQNPKKSSISNSFFVLAEKSDEGNNDTFKELRSPLKRFLKL